MNLESRFLSRFKRGNGVYAFVGLLALLDFAIYQLLVPVHELGRLIMAYTQGLTVIKVVWYNPMAIWNAWTYEDPHQSDLGYVLAAGVNLNRYAAADATYHLLFGIAELVLVILVDGWLAKKVLTV